MTYSESMREDQGRYWRTSKNLDERSGEQDDCNREISREEYKGGYDPGFLAGGDGYHRTGKNHDGYGGGARTAELGGYCREISRGKYRGGYDPGFLG
jgi:hypothetical protein